MLTNGNGGVDWSALPFACSYYGVSDIDGLVQRLMVIKQYSHTKDE